MLKKKKKTTIYVKNESSLPLKQQKQNKPKKSTIDDEVAGFRVSI